MLFFNFILVFSFFIHVSVCCLSLSVFLSFALILFRRRSLGLVMYRIMSLHPGLFLLNPLSSLILSSAIQMMQNHAAGPLVVAKSIANCPLQLRLTLIQTLMIRRNSLIPHLTGLQVDRHRSPCPTPCPHVPLSLLHPPGLCLKALPLLGLEAALLMSAPVGV